MRLREGGDGDWAGGERGGARQGRVLADACEMGNLPGVELMLASGADPEGADLGMGRLTHLMRVAGSGRPRAPECALALLRAGANPAALSSEGLTAKGMAALMGHDEVAGAIAAWTLARAEERMLSEQLAGSGEASGRSGRL